MFDFKELFNAFREDSMMETLLTEFSLMIEDSRWMFEVIGRSLVDGRDPEDHKDEIYTRDIRLNQTERNIRKKIIEHLSLNPGHNLGTCLVLFSAVKDAERLGDYCKNLFEVAQWLHGKSYPEGWADKIQDLHKRITDFFLRAATSFSAANAEEAHKLMEDVRALEHECDVGVKAVLEGDVSCTPPQAAATSLTLRYFKRTAAHIGNIASGLVNPVHKIDYYSPEARG